MNSTLAVFNGAFRENLRRILLWFVAVFGVSAMYIAWYPLMVNSGAQLVESLPKEIITAFNWEDIASAPGYLTSTIFGLIAPGLTAVFAIGLGAKMLAGDEEEGTLELEMSAPVSRLNLLLQRLLALWAAILVVVAAVGAAAVVMVLAMGMDVGLVGILAGSTGLLLLIAGFGTVAFATGAATGRRSVGLAVASAFALLSYVFNSMGPILGMDWMLTISPFSWYLEPRPLFEGFDWPHLAALAAVSIVAALVGVVWYGRRNLMT